MDYNFANEMERYPKYKKKFGTGFLTCSSDGNSSDSSSKNDRYANFQSFQKGYGNHYSIRSETSVGVINRRPPPSPSEPQRHRYVMTKTLDDWNSTESWKRITCITVIRTGYQNKEIMISVKCSLNTVKTIQHELEKCNEDYKAVARRRQHNRRSGYRSVQMEAYNPDVAPSDYHLFRRISNGLCISKNRHSRGKSVSRSNDTNSTIITLDSEEKDLTPKKSSSFQSFPSKLNQSPKRFSKNNFIHASPRKLEKYDDSKFYSLQRPKRIIYPDDLMDHEMDLETMRPKVHFIRRSAKPSFDNQRRREYSLKFMIESIENVTSKKRYHCELKLNNRTYARTSSRVAEKNEAVWNEIYELCNLSPVTSVTINLYKEMVEGKSGKRKNVRQKIGFVTLPIEELYERNEVKKKLTMQKYPNAHLDHANDSGFCLPSESRSNDMQNKSKRLYRSEGSDSDIPQMHADYCSSSLPRENCALYPRSSFMRYLRSKKESENYKICISAKYQCIEILPVNCYTHLREFILDHYQCLVQYLDNKLCGRRLEEIASSLVSIHELVNNAPQFITNSICYKLESANDPQSIALRSNTIGSKAMESYMKLIGMDYLKSILGEFAMKIVFYPSSLEVDPSRLEDKYLLKLTQVQLCSMVHSLWNKIANSTSQMPLELKRVFSSLRYALEKNNNPEFADQLLSGCVFLRFICPAILNPYLYQLIQEYPQDPRIIRNFTLISKSLQTLANQTGTFNDKPSLKEPFMTPIHESLASERNSMITFLREISSESVQEFQSSSNKFGLSKWHQYIDVGYELAVSHSYYVEIFLTPAPYTNLPQGLKPLIPILQELNTYQNSKINQNTTEMAELLSRNCKLLADSAIDEYSPETNNKREFKTDLSTKQPNHTQKSEMNYNYNNHNTLRKNYAEPTVTDCHNVERKDINRSNTLNVEEINYMWKCLVEKAENHLMNSEQGPAIDIDLDPDFQMEYQFCFDPIDDVMEKDNFSISNFINAPMLNVSTKESFMNGDYSSKDSSPVINYPPPPPIETLPQNSVGTFKLSPTKSIRMGTKAVQTVQNKKMPNELETMRRMVTEAESKYLMAQKEIADKEEENRLLRELLRNQTTKSAHKDDIR